MTKETSYTRLPFGTGLTIALIVIDVIFVVMYFQRFFEYAYSEIYLVGGGFLLLILACAVKIAFQGWALIDPKLSVEEGDLVKIIASFLLIGILNMGGLCCVWSSSLNRKEAYELITYTFWLMYPLMAAFVPVMIYRFPQCKCLKPWAEVPSEAESA